MARIRLVAGSWRPAPRGDGLAGWTSGLLTDLDRLLGDRGHRCTLGVSSVPDPEPVAIHLLIGVEPAPQALSLRADVAIADEAMPAETHAVTLDLAVRLHELLPELGAEQPWPRLSAEDCAQARAACAYRIALPPRCHGDGAGRTALAERLATALEAHLHAVQRQAYGFRVARWARRAVDIWHEVPLVPQTTDMSCWAAAAAMVVGWRDQIAVDTAEIARGTGRWEAYRDGLTPDDVATLARVWDLTIEPPRTYASADLEDLLRRYGPLWVGQADPDLHVICVVGMSGDGTADGTLVRINDPWPPGRGERYSLTLGELAGNFRTASALVGMHIQILHGNGRR